MANKKKTGSTPNGHELNSCKIINAKVKSIKVKQFDKDFNPTLLSTDSVEIIRYNLTTAVISLFNGKIEAKLTDLILDKEGNIHVRCDNGKEYLIYQQDDLTYNIVEKNESNKI